MFGATKIEMEILSQLKGGEHLYGLEMVKRSDGAIKKGTVYVYLNRMEEKEWISSEAEKEPSQPGLPRRKYWLTGKGARVYERAVKTASVFDEAGEGTFA